MFHEITGIFGAGGIIMWPLLVTSLWIWFLMTWWWWQLRHEAVTIGKLAEETANIFCSMGKAECMKYLHGKRGFFAQSLFHFFTISRAELSRGDYDALFLEAGLRLSGHGNYLRALVKISPLLGLLGTICGMVATFQVLHLYGVADPRSLSAGISSALLTTQAGLMIALPGFFGHDWLVKLDRKVHAELQKASRVLSVVTD